MEPLDNYYTKSTAVGVICAEVSVGRPAVERAFKELQEAGRITFVRPPFSHAMLISRTDVETVKQYIKSNKAS